MISFTVHRLIIMVPTLIGISLITFVIIQLPPGDFLSTMIAECEAQGESGCMEQIGIYRQEFGLDRPMSHQYVIWVADLVRGDMGISFEYNRPVAEVIGESLWLTIIVSGATIIFTWVVAFPIGVYSATHQYSWGDHGLTFLGFLGLATPNFLLALEPALRREEIISLSFVEAAAGETAPASYLERFGGTAEHDYLWFTPATPEIDYCAHLR